MTRIILLSDGTGNSAGKVWRTNVWRLFQLLDLKSSDQTAKYDDGVGTSSFLPLAILGGAFGYGLKRNILDAYKFICRNYDHANGSKIYLLGFSRGAGIGSSDTGKDWLRPQLNQSCTTEQSRLTDHTALKATRDKKREFPSRSRKPYR